MSTRSIIAYPEGDSWTGIYCHMDGYPTWQGVEIWRVLQTECGGEAPRFRREYIEAHPGGWSSFDDQCYCHAACPESSDGWYSAADEATNTALLMEWVYVIGTHVLTVLTSVPTGQTLPADPGSGWREAVYRWAMVAQIPLDGPEPDWEAIEALGMRLKAAWARFAA